ncbi:MAG TPA: hypothetical protein VE422_18685 [Terriglobia bacterium]|nr:hypothetical protein [Terriglobia bacterium]
MSKSRIGRRVAAEAVALIFLVAVSDLPAQFQPPGALGALAPENLAKPRPKPPFDLTGTWLHGGGADNGFRFTPPAGLKLTPESQVHYDAARKAQSEGKVYRDDIGQCWPAGLPVIMTRVWPIAMIQLPTAVYMISEFMNSLRVVYLDGRPHTDPDIAVPSFNGESIGHWENDTLVIDSKYFVPDHHWIDSGIPGSDALHIVERIRMIDQGKTLSIEYSFTDPKSWEGTWSLTKRWRRVDERDIAEVSCLPDLNDHMPTTHSDANVR